MFVISDYKNKDWVEQNSDKIFCVPKQHGWLLMLSITSLPGNDMMKYRLPWYRWNIYDSLSIRKCTVLQKQKQSLPAGCHQRVLSDNHLTSSRGWSCSWCGLHLLAWDWMSEEHWSPVHFIQSWFTGRLCLLAAWTSLYWETLAAVGPSNQWQPEQFRTWTRVEWQHGIPDATPHRIKQMRLWNPCASA